MIANNAQYRKQLNNLSDNPDNPEKPSTILVSDINQV